MNDAQEHSRLVIDDPARDGTRLAIFVHGLGGAAHNFWGDARTLLVEDPQLRREGVRFGFWGYKTSPLPQGPLIERLLRKRPRLPGVRELGEFLWDDVTSLQNDRFSRITLIGHSMGGLIAQAAACHAAHKGPPEFERLAGIGLCATPTAGHQIAAIVAFMAKIWGGNAQVEDLSVNEERRIALQQEFIRIVDGSGNRIAIKNWLAVYDSIVTDREMDTYLSRYTRKIGGDHSTCIRQAENVGAFKDWLIQTLVGPGDVAVVAAPSAPESRYLKELAELYLQRRPQDYSVRIEERQYVSETERDIVEHTSTFSCPGEPLMAMRVALGCTQPVHALPTMEDLGVKFALLPEGVSAILVPLTEQPPLMRGAIFFSPPLDGENTIRYRYVWKGLWNALRERGEDEGSFRAGPPVKEFTTVLEFPPGTEGIEVLSSASELEVRCTEDTARPQAVLTCRAPVAGKLYKYGVRGSLPKWTK